MSKEKLNPELQRKYCDAISLGLDIEAAASYVGIVSSTVYKWMKKGNNAKRGRYRDFLSAVEKAYAIAEVRDLSNIDKAARGMPAEYDKQGKKIRDERYADWKASAWKLERRFPRKWGRKQQLALSEDNQEQAQMALADSIFHKKIMDIVESNPDVDQDFYGEDEDETTNERNK